MPRTKVHPISMKNLPVFLNEKFWKADAKRGRSNKALISPGLHAF
jgi:hypothetical protein